MTIAADATVTDAAALMDNAAVGSVVVLDGERAVGIVSDRDLVERGAAARRMPPDSGGCPRSTTS